MNNKEYYIYGLFYKDEDGDEVCFYIGSGQGKRMKEHFYPSNLERNEGHKTRKILKLQRNEKDPYPKKLQTGLTLKEARKLEKSLLNRDRIWENITNMKQEVYGGRPKKVSKNEKREIRWLINNTEVFNREISEKYEVSKVFVDKLSKNGPEKKPDKILEPQTRKNSNISTKQVREIKWLLENTQMYQTEIAEKLETTRRIVSCIKLKKSHNHIQGTRKPDWK